jgi:hypothetical protein
MKIKTAVAVAAVAALAGTSYGQFSGVYAPGNWTFNANGGGGSVNWAGAPGIMDLTGDDTALGPFDTDLTIMVPAAGTLAFSWLYTTIDTGTYDSAYYLINGSPTFLSDNTTPGATGLISVPVNAGDTIGFRVTTADGAFGPGVLTIRDFSAPVPAPGSLALLGAGGLVAMRRRRR